MNVLITGAASRLGRAVAAELGSGHQLRLIDHVSRDASFEPGDEVEFMQGSLLDPDTAWNAVRGMDALIHTGEPPRDLPEDGLGREEFLLDLATRGTHVLFKAAVEAGVKRLVYGSTLEIFGAYPDDVYISEYWKPLPTPEIHQMARYLGERVCMEFARDHMVAVTVLRLGRPVLEDEVAGEAPDLMWLDLRDAARAFGWALDRPAGNQVRWTRRFALYHICGDIPNPRFLIDQAATKGFTPRHGFEAHWPAASGDPTGGGAA